MVQTRVIVEVVDFDSGKVLDMALTLDYSTHPRTRGRGRGVSVIWVECSLSYTHTPAHTTARICYDK
jgi:hypothetical protein